MHFRRPKDPLALLQRRGEYTLSAQALIDEVCVVFGDHWIRSYPNICLLWGSMSSVTNLDRGDRIGRRLKPKVDVPNKCSA